MYQLANPYGGAWDPSIAEAMSDQYGLTREEFNLLMGVEPASQPDPPPAQNTFNPTITYDKNLSAKDLAADQSKLGGAVGVINSNWQAGAGRAQPCVLKIDQRSGGSK